MPTTTVVEATVHVSGLGAKLAAVLRLAFAVAFYSVDGDGLEVSIFLFKGARDFSEVTGGYWPEPGLITSCGYPVWWYSVVPVP